MTMVKQKKIEIPAGEFKAKCLQLMDEVQRDNIEIIITKRGKPVARLVPIEEVARPSRFGCLAGQMTIIGDIIAPIDVKWDADF
jgi:prevent-host-death family protein